MSLPGRDEMVSCSVVNFLGLMGARSSMDSWARSVLNQSTQLGPGSTELVWYGGVDSYWGYFGSMKPRSALEIERFAVHDRVTHDKYGLGRVLVADTESVTVDFGSQRVRIESPFLKLSKL